jgi:hypothetical protein
VRRPGAPGGAERRRIDSEEARRLLLAATVRRLVDPAERVEQIEQDRVTGCQLVTSMLD